jgi:hypothetical protein
MVEIVRVDGELVVLFPGVPKGWHPRLVPGPDPAGPPVIRGGPYDGLPVTAVERDGTWSLVIGGRLRLPRWGPAEENLIRGLPAPSTSSAQPEVETERRYAELLERALGAGGAVVQPPAGLRLAPWVRWVTEQQVVLLHGSGDGHLDVLIPRRNSYELDDQHERGNRAAVYATDDGWWALWFAILDRDRVRGSTRNGVEVFTDAGGRRLPVYHFSLDRRLLPARPYRAGWLYLLPRGSFECMPVLPGGPPSCEWCGEAPVRPLARLPVTPADFPFLDQIGGHDDGELWRYGELADLIRERVISGRRTPTGVALRLVWDATTAAVGEEYLDLGRRLMPEISRELHWDADGIGTLRFDAPPPFAALLQNTYADLLDG